MNRWNILETDADLPLMAAVLHISEVTARVMANRGIRSKKTAQAFLSPVLSSLHDPSLMKDAEKAVRLMAEAAARREKIMVYGDYDADGVVSTVVLYKTLARYGAEVDYYIPLRTEEGYGLNMDAVRRMKAAGVEWIITVDNGISALDEIAEARRLGIRVIVVDHHEPGFVEANGKREDVLPDADALVDPKQASCAYPFKSLCAAGLAYKLAGAFCAHTGMPFSDHDELLALTAIATLCDIVELTDENRVIVYNGLAALNRNKLINPGLGSLITRRGYLDKPVDTFAAGYVLGPCINATGRLESADLSVQLMLASTDDGPTRLALAERLTDLNEERRSMTGESVQRVLDSVSDLPDKVLVLVDYETHESIAGIVAGRVREAVNRPVIVLTRSETAEMKGSGRSIEGYNLFEALYRHRQLFLRFGGHAMAAGLTLPEENIPALREALNADCLLTEDDFHAVFPVDGILDPDDITLALSEELNRLAPFGRGNREPLFVSYGLAAESVRVINEKNTLIFTFLTPKKRRLKGICFGLNERYAEEIKGLPAGGPFHMDAVYGIETNVYNGNVSVQVRIRDFSLRHRA